MKNAPKFSDLGDISFDKKEIKSTEIDSTIEDPNKRLTKYDYEINQRREKIQEKIDTLEKKLKAFSIKEAMIDNIINRTYTELENLNENEFTKRGQKQSVLIKQLEAHAVLQDTMIKWETMLQNYHKILLDIENNKLNSYHKIVQMQKEEEKDDENLANILSDLNKQLLNPSTNNQGDDISKASSLLDEIERELKENNY